MGKLGAVEVVSAETWKLPKDRFHANWSVILRMVKTCCHYMSLYVTTVSVSAVWMLFSGWNCWNQKRVSLLAGNKDVNTMCVCLGMRTK